MSRLLRLKECRTAYKNAKHMCHSNLRQFLNFNQIVKSFSAATMSKLLYSKYGNPVEELSVVEDPIADGELQPGQVHIRVLLSPVNPSDLFTVHGTYPNRPALPSTPGLEGVAEVVISASEKFQPGDRVLVQRPFFGYWRQQAIANEAELMKLPKELPAEAAATLIVNPCTAYLMLQKVVNLNPGDVVLQNGANSALGVIVIQLAKHFGYKTVNVIRQRPNLQETVQGLKDLGADVVITDDELQKGWDGLNLGLARPKLALECVGGPAAAKLAALLDNGGTMVVYGLLSMQPAQVGQADLIVRDIRVVGFYLTKWIGQNLGEFGKLLQELAGLYIQGKLKLGKFRKFPLAQWQDAIKASTAGFTNEKVLLQLN